MTIRAPISNRIEPLVRMPSTGKSRRRPGCAAPMVPATTPQSASGAPPHTTAPMSVVDQIVSVTAGTGGYLDDLPVSEVRRFETAPVRVKEIGAHAESRVRITIERK